MRMVNLFRGRVGLVATSTVVVETSTFQLGIRVVLS